MLDSSPTPDVVFLFLFPCLCLVFVLVLSCLVQVTSTGDPTALTWSVTGGDPYGSTDSSGEGLDGGLYTVGGGMYAVMVVLFCRCWLVWPGLVDVKKGSLTRFYGGGGGRRLFSMLCR